MADTYSAEELMCLDYDPSAASNGSSAAAAPSAAPVDISGDGSLMKVVLREGGGGGVPNQPVLGDECTVHYHGEQPSEKKSECALFS
jgi:hypothetical protein